MKLKLGLEFALGFALTMLCSSRAYGCFGAVSPLFVHCECTGEPYNTTTCIGDTISTCHSIIPGSLCGTGGGNYCYVPYARNKSCLGGREEASIHSNASDPVLRAAGIQTCEHAAASLALETDLIAKKEKHLFNLLEKN